MPNNNRTHISIIADILDTARQYSYEGYDNGSGAPVTHLIRKANVPHRRLSSIVSDLKAYGLLDEAPDSKYRISEKGMEFLKSYNQFKGFAENFGLKI
ncbi:putative transcriptional regulator [Candidatus Nitrososphaera evergladensis SR1]|jgi:predicted transcriptional regulator|uniref:Putative transcriptional regulator n=1 Tax=Candidatus Nitrososphaera evergladensis SR1 TaxID=1459636 RepID=A0A075MPK6_9ARCH|nr:winged helix-turn-helix domain-containing protein [Candidatus Nitrososphaera evergladensis]AIF82742.1 putative transcriptional regulator [Candidatus Nitrososphaera evergladensis SR1]